jgi:hypothetical protein
VNPEYQDRNFAGMLIIWDRIFGTFEPEVAPPVYGLTKPLRSWNPLWANVHVFGEMAAKLRAARTWGERWRAVLGHPGWVPPATLVAATFYVLLSLGNIGGILEARAWSGPSEIARLLILGGVSGALLAGGGGPPGLLAAAAGFALLSLLWILRLRPLLTSSDARAVVVM